MVRATANCHRILFKNSHTRCSISTYHSSHMLSLLNNFSILHIKNYLCLWSQKLEYPLKNLQAGNNTIFLANKLYLTFFVMRHNGIGSYILAVNILLQCHFDKFICCQQHGNLVHYNLSFHINIEIYIFKSNPAYLFQIIIFVSETFHLFLGDHMGHRAVCLHIWHQHLLFWAKETSTFPHKGNTTEYQHLAIQACCHLA